MLKVCFCLVSTRQVDCYPKRREILRGRVVFSLNSVIIHIPLVKQFSWNQLMVSSELWSFGKSLFELVSYMSILSYPESWWDIAHNINQITGATFNPLINLITSTAHKLSLSQNLFHIHSFSPYHSLSFIKTGLTADGCSHTDMHRPGREEAIRPLSPAEYKFAYKHW